VMQPPMMPPVRIQYQTNINKQTQT